MSYANSHTQGSSAPTQSGAALHNSASPTAPRMTLSSHNLLRGHKAVAIEHNGATYRLQATKLGKLILTK